ncbi:hypothetical protein BK010_10305 [Tenericutes bacterium MO-XQ]|nr:hypothetical protein BK010_10305 [Tenericutes bacterium MO-XQ]
MISIFHSRVNKTRRYRKKHKLFTALKLLVVLLLGAGIFTIGKAATKDILVNIEIKEFKDRAIFEYEENYEYQTNVFQTRRYYKVPRETSYELSDERSVFYDDTRKYLGQTGDIFMSQESPFPDVFFIHQFISYYFGGHAAIKTDDNRFIEAVGFPDSDETIWDIISHDGSLPHDYSVTINKTNDNYFLNPRYRAEGSEFYDYFGTYYREKFIGVRVKDVTEEQYNGAVAYADQLVDKNLYNFLFFLDMEYKYYCTDLVSRAYQDVMVPEDEQTNYSKALNDDGFITSVNDIILSEETYIAFYIEVIDEIVHIYYLEDVEG